MLIKKQKIYPIFVLTCKFALINVRGLEMPEGVVVLVVDDEVVVKDAVVALQVELEAPPVSEKVQPDLVPILGQTALVALVLLVHRVGVVVEGVQVVILDVLARTVSSRQAWNKNTC